MRLCASGMVGNGKNSGREREREKDGGRGGESGEEGKKHTRKERLEQQFSRVSFQIMRGAAFPPSPPFLFYSRWSRLPESQIRADNNFFFGFPFVAAIW